MPVCVALSLILTLLLPFVSIVRSVQENCVDGMQFSLDVVLIVKVKDAHNLAVYNRFNYRHNLIFTTK